MLSITRASIVIFLLFTSIMSAQQDSLKTISDNKEQFKRKFSFAFSLRNVNPTGDNFAGEGLSNGLGGGLGIHYYMTHDFYIGGALEYDGLRIDDISIVGPYERITKFNTYIYVGYEFTINDQFRLLSDIGYGHTENRNRQNVDQGGAKFKDTGGLLRIGTSLDFLISDKMAFYVGPSYEYVFYDIDAARSLETNFERGNYFNITLGIRLITPK